MDFFTKCDQIRRSNIFMVLCVKIEVDVFQIKNEQFSHLYFTPSPFPLKAISADTYIFVVEYLFKFFNTCESETRNVVRCSKKVDVRRYSAM